MKHNVRTGASLLVLVVLTSCQPGTGEPKTVSLDTAKQVTAEFGGAAVALPPHKITDVLAFLDQAPADLERTAELRERLTESPPDTTRAGKLAAFYYDRSEAARELGLAKQAMEDAEQAYALARKAFGQKVDFVPTARIRGKVLNGRDYAGNAKTVQSLWGNKQRALQLAEIRLRLASNPHDRFLRLASLAAYHGGAGNLGEADRYFEAAKIAYNSDPKKTARSHFWWNELHGLLHLHRGEYDQAAEHFRKTLPIIPRLKHAKDLAVQSWGQLAEALLRSGRLLEAEVEARAAIQASVEITGGVSAVTGYSLTVLAQVLSAEGRDKEAELLVLNTLRLFERGGVDSRSELVRNSKHTLAQLTAARRDWTESRRLFEEILSAETQLSWVEHNVRQGATYPLVLIESGAAEQARSLLQSNYETRLKRLGSDHQQTAELGGVLAVALARLGETGEALRLYRETIPVLVSRSRETLKVGTAATASERTLNYILANYLKLLADLRGSELERTAGIDAAAEGFAIADLARGRAVQGRSPRARRARRAGMRSWRTWRVASRMRASRSRRITPSWRRAKTRRRRKTSSSGSTPCARRARP
jgi:tetratricopeptide (TPR) repeat protein